MGARNSASALPAAIAYRMIRTIRLAAESAACGAVSTSMASASAAAPVEFPTRRRVARCSHLHSRCLAGHRTFVVRRDDVDPTMVEQVPIPVATIAIASVSLSKEGEQSVVTARRRLARRPDDHPPQRRGRWPHSEPDHRRECTHQRRHDDGRRIVASTRNVNVADCGTATRTTNLNTGPSAMVHADRHGRRRQRGDGQPIELAPRHHRAEHRTDVHRECRHRRGGRR